jgi:chromodomain-helicase-DNA-binding protein 6
VIIFSQFKMMHDILHDYLHWKGYTFEYISGDVNGIERQKAIDRFQSPEGAFIMLLTTKAGGVGITLTAADTCIIYDSDWNPQNDLQAMARCHRIGQTKAVKIYRLLTAKTYESHMFHISSMKLGLDRAVLHGTDGFNGKSEDKNGLKLSKAEVENLLKRGAYAVFNEEDNDASKQSTGCPETLFPSVFALLAPLQKKTPVVDQAFGEDDIDRILERGEADAADDTGALHFMNNVVKLIFEGLG